MCFCKSDRESFESIQTYWGPNVLDFTKHSSLVLVGTLLGDVKSGTEPEITTAEGSQLADELGAKSYMECHLSNQEDIDRLFQTVLLIAKTHKRRKSLIEKFFGK